MNKKLVSRDIFPQIKKHLRDKEITVITGARQTGKTTLLLQLKDYLIKDKKISSSKIKIFNLDLITDLTLFRDQADFIKYLKDELRINRNLYIFIDEVQRLENPGVFLKGIYDLMLPVKFVVTGSSSLEVKAKISESLAGRKRIFSLYPFSFCEFLSFKNNALYRLISKPKAISSYHRREIFDYLYDFIIYGSYPRVALEDNKEEKMRFLEEIYSSYIERDIIGFMKVKSQFAYTKLVTLLAGQIGQLINLHEISSTIRLNHRTLDNYLYLLENTYVLVRLRPYFTNLRKELTKMPKVYFIDTGLRNFALKNFAAFEDNRDKGSLLENFCFSSLVKIWKGSIYFWRTKEKTEVDFLVKDMYGNIIPIEVKAQRLAKPVISRGFQSFLKKYKVKKGYIVNLDLKSKVKLNDTIIEFILPYEVPFLIK